MTTVTVGLTVRRSPATQEGSHVPVLGAPVLPPLPDRVPARSAAVA